MNECTQLTINYSEIVCSFLQKVFRKKITNNKQIEIKHPANSTILKYSLPSDVIITGLPKYVDLA